MRDTMEPVSLKRCEPEETSLPGRLFTCARLGRSLGRRAELPDELVESWIDGLPKADTIHLVTADPSVL